MGNKSKNESNIFFPIPKYNQTKQIISVLDTTNHSEPTMTDTIESFQPKSIGNKDFIVQMILDNRLISADTKSMSHDDLKLLRNELVNVYRFINAMNDFRDGNITLDQLSKMVRIDRTDDVELGGLYPTVVKPLQNEFINICWFDDALKILDIAIYDGTNGEIEDAIKTLQKARSTSDPVLPLDELFPYVPETWKHELFNKFAQVFSHIDPKEVIGILDPWLHVKDIDAMAIDIVSSTYQLMLDYFSSEYMRRRGTVIAALHEELKFKSFNKGGKALPDAEYEARLAQKFYSERMEAFERTIDARTESIYEAEEGVRLIHEECTKKMERELNRWIDGEAATSAKYLKSHFNSLQTEEQIITRMRQKFKLATAKMPLYLHPSDFEAQNRIRVELKSMMKTGKLPMYCLVL